MDPRGNVREKERVVLDVENVSWQLAVQLSP